MKAILYTDGSCLGNPGPAGIGVVLISHNETIKVSEPIGHGTNNVAEYKALLRGLELALERGYSEIKVNLDSNIVASQVLGQYRVSEKLAGLCAQVRELLKNFKTCHISWIPRELNDQADKLAKQAASNIF